MITDNPLVTLGSPRGIGYEIFLRSFSESTLFQDHRPFAAGSRSILDYYQNLLGTKLQFRVLQSGETPLENDPADFYLYDVDEKPFVIAHHDRIDPETDGLIALRSIRLAADLVTQGSFNSVATLPVSKENIHLHLTDFAGHTEFFQKEWDEESVFMTFVSKKLNLLLLTTHIPLSEVSRAITPEVLEKGILTALKLRNHLGLSKKAGLLGLNPHSGENGVIGTDELGWKPVLEKYRNELEGPVPADTAFTHYNIDRCSIWIACYHDQGLIPFKMLAFDDGVNLSYGMKHIRTSVDHGTAVSLIGKKTAGIESFIQAYRLALKLSVPS